MPTPLIPSDPDGTFRIGLCMAGAVSAGAYTAGVVDFLNEALAEWEQRKLTDASNTPSHKVQIPVIGGASAGGMTGVILASALYGRLDPVYHTDDAPALGAKRNRLFSSWVELVTPDMFPVMLNPRDIEREGTTSLLNADFILQIANRSIVVDADWVERPWFPRHLKIFTTLTNLEGFNYAINFGSNDRSNGLYHVRIHNDYACFVLNKALSDYGHDGWIPLDFRNNVNTTIARDAAMGTGAFPVGLRVRSLSRPFRYVRDNPWLNEYLKDDPRPDDALYGSWNVDGGVINNEPFDKVRGELLGLDGGPGDATRIRRQEEYNTFDRTVLMVDPFPSSLEDFEFKKELIPAIGSTLGAMLSQLRTKPKALFDAMSSNQAGQFLIAPSRTLPIEVARDPENPTKGLHVVGASAIACGALGGFGGFLEREFRVHDYFLGRANCERFLREHFTVPFDTTNRIFTQGYEHIADKEKFRSAIATDRGLQIIPLFSPRPPEGAPLPMPRFSNGRHDWPVQPEDRITRFRGMLKDRAGAVLNDQLNANWFVRVLVKLKGSGMLADAALDAILESLKHSYLVPGEPKKPRKMAMRKEEA